MEIFNTIIDKINSFVWGPIIIIFLVGTGFILTMGTRVIQFRKMGYAFKLLFSKEDLGEGDITPFQALMTSLAATIGTGNIAGVAGAIAAGGPGAVFWMWVTAAVGGATKYGEAVLAVKYRQTNELGEKSGGPMYYIKEGMKEKFGKNFAWLGWLFAFFGLMASFGIGNMTQANSIASSLKVTLNIDPRITGAVIAIVVGIVIIGGIKSIANVTDKIVPVMAVIYVIGSIVILFKNGSMIGNAFSMIFSTAFTGKAVAGALVGTVIRYGVARGVFSNEAGLGSAPIAHAASKNDDPVKQGIIASLGSFLDTIVVCTMTALVILTSGLIAVNNDGLMTVDGLTVPERHIIKEFESSDFNGTLQGDEKATTNKNIINSRLENNSLDLTVESFKNTFPNFTILGKNDDGSDKILDKKDQEMIVNFYKKDDPTILDGAALTTTAFGATLPKFGKFIVSFGLIFFAFSTILGWFYYGSKCLEYIAGTKIIMAYKIIFIVIIFIGSFYEANTVWNLSDTFNGAMAIPNLIALLFLSPAIFTMTKDYEKKSKK